MKVDLPEPDGPMTATYSLRRISRFTPRSACTTSEPIRYVLAQRLDADHHVRDSAASGGASGGGGLRGLAHSSLPATVSSSARDSW